MTKTINMNKLESRMLNTATARKAFEKFDQELAIMEKLYAMREHAGLSQRGLAEHLGISLSAINRLEKNPAAASLKKFRTICISLWSKPHATTTLSTDCSLNS